MEALKEELESMKNSLFEEKETKRKLQAEADASQSKFLDMQRSERVVRVDLEQLQRTVIGVSHDNDFLGRMRND